jgi:hypothetical protein
MWSAVQPECKTALVTSSLATRIPSASDNPLHQPRRALRARPREPSDHKGCPSERSSKRRSSVVAFDYVAGTIGTGTRISSGEPDRALRRLGLEGSMIAHRPRTRLCRLAAVLHANLCVTVTSRSMVVGSLRVLSVSSAPRAATTRGTRRGAYVQPEPDGRKEAPDILEVEARTHRQTALIELRGELDLTTAPRSPKRSTD